MHKIIALVGMTGSGKSVVADYLTEKGWGFARFGQIVLDEVRNRGLEPKEENERPIREEMRAKHGMAAMAILNIPKFDTILKEKDLIADGLYSWSEYKELKKYYGDRLKVIAVYCPPELRYERLAGREWKADDKEMRHRPATKDQARSRDFAEIEKIEKGGPIAMADFTILNTKDKEYVYQQMDEVIKELN